MLNLIILKSYDFISKICYNLGLGNSKLILKLATRLRSNIVPNYVIIENHKIFLDKMDSLSLSIKGKNFEKNETQIMKKIIKNGQTVLDIGAHIGYFSLMFAKLVGENGKVYSFEPVPSNFELLKKNIRVNKYSNIIFEENAVLDIAKKIKMYLSIHNAADNRTTALDKNSKYILVNSVKLDDYFKDCNKPIEFIKMDVQGSEPAVFRGMNEIILKNTNIKIITEFSPELITKAGYDPKEFITKILDYGFNIFDLEENKKDPINIMQLLEKYTHENEKFTNLLCMKMKRIDELNRN